MAIIYVDLVNGHDAAPGDGSAANPYLTLNKADGIAAGPHDIRVAKTTAAAAVGAANTWSCASGLVTSDGVLSVQFQIRCNAYNIYWDDVVIT